MKILCKLKYGSHLYGCNTSTSDIDFKGIYLPTLNDYLLENVKKSINNSNKISNTLKNQAGDVDEEYYSLNYFIKLALEGDTTTIDMLHSPNGWEDITSDVWEELKSKRHLFYSKNLKSYIGYCRKQAARYSCRGSRLDAAKQVIDFCNDQILIQGGKYKLGNYILTDNHLDIPQNNYSKITTVIKVDDQIDWQYSYYHILEKHFSFNDTLESLLKSTIKFYEAYGARAKLAANNSGIDWKSIHHAFRAGLQMKEILETKNLLYPLKDAEFLVNIKKGKYHFINDGISKKLDDLVDEVKILSDSSGFQETADNEYWEHWLLETIKNNIY